jgi:signal transduction histidine kinase
MSEINLQNESILITVRKHWVILARDSAAAMIAGFLPFFLIGIVSNAPYGFTADLSFLSVISILWLLVCWMVLAMIWTAYYLDIWIVTDKHIYVIDQVGLFDRKVRTLSLDRIEEINVRTDGFLQTYFNFGSIDILTASPTEENAHFEGMPNPPYVRALILDQIEHFVKLEKENKELVTTTKDQEKLIHLVGHEVKGYLTKSSAALAAIAEGDLGQVPQPVQKIAGSALTETRKGVDTVMNILHGANPAKGTLAIEKKPFDVKAAVLAIAQSLKPVAEAKGLAFNLYASEGTYTLAGDEAKLRDHVFRNLIDNSLRYTQRGAIRMDLMTNGKIVRFQVEDTGVGITREDMQKLFTEGGHGTHSTDVNPESTGFGLSIAKQVVEAHGGRIWAESAGQGQGSTFIVELPVV